MTLENQTSFPPTARRVAGRQTTAFRSGAVFGSRPGLPDFEDSPGLPRTPPAKGLWFAWSIGRSASRQTSEWERPQNGGLGTSTIGRHSGPGQPASGRRL